VDTNDKPCDEQCVFSLVMWRISARTAEGETLWVLESRPFREAASGRRAATNVST
jgi:hypothetical protein